MFILCVTLLWRPDHAFADSRKITVGTGGISGVYYPAGVGICDAVNKHVRDYRLTCKVINTAGSTYNVEHVRDGTLTFGIVQSDVKYYAVKGYGPFKNKGPDTKMRSVFSLHSEPFTVVAHANAGILAFKDLKGKRVNIGNVGSGQRISMDLVMHVMGWTNKDFSEVYELPTAEQAKAFCENKVDAIVFTAGHPNASVKKIMDDCHGVLVNAASSAIVRLIKKYPYITPVIIPANIYKNTPRRTLTFGVKATLVTSQDTPDDVVFGLISSFFWDIVDFKFSHPAFVALSPEDMVSHGKMAPIHPGALRFYKNAGNLSAPLKKITAPRR